MQLHQMFSFPVACLVFAAIGLALGLEHAQGRPARRPDPGARRSSSSTTPSWPWPRPGPRASRATADRRQRRSRGHLGPVDAEHRPGRRRPAFARRGGRRGRRAVRTSTVRDSRRGAPRCRPPGGGAAAGGRVRELAGRSCCACRGWTCPCRGCWTAMSACDSCPVGRARLPGPAGALLHRRVRRPGGQALQASRRTRGCSRASCSTRRRNSSSSSSRSPMLIAVLGTIGGLTRSSELVVMRACGVSLYRTALPLLRLRAGRQRAAVRGRGARAGRGQQGRPRTPGLAPRPEAAARPRSSAASNNWLVGEDGRIYAYAAFGTGTRLNGSQPAIQGLSVFEPADHPYRLRSHLYAARARFDGSAWRARTGLDASEFDRRDRRPGRFRAADARAPPRSRTSSARRSIRAR